MRLLLLMLVLVSVPTKKHRQTWNPVLKGSHESMVRQNEEINRLQLPRIVDDVQLKALVRTAELVPITPSRTLIVGGKVENRYCRPWTRQFIEDISGAFFSSFHRPLMVTSAVRTMEQQRVLTLTNRAAAPAYGEIASSHLAGVSVDIGKRGLTRAQHQWVEKYLKTLYDEGLIEAAEEHSQACFHVMVRNKYGVN